MLNSDFFIVKRGIKITELWVLILYISGETETAKNAIHNLRNVCSEYLKNRCDITVVDLKKHPEIAAQKEIVAIPTLVKERPLPVRMMIGDLHSTKKVLIGLDIEHREK
ncbi:MAG TPA: circadian clock KaiB family protein [Methanocella sp.]|nr:circadian clock KaiB family protein [Methanocella sp.]